MAASGDSLVSAVSTSNAAPPSSVGNSAKRWIIHPTRSEASIAGVTIPDALGAYTLPTRRISNRRACVSSLSIGNERFGW